MLNFRKVETLNFLILALIFIAKSLDMIQVIGTTQLSNYLFCNVPAYVLAIIGLIFFLLLLYLLEQFNTGHVDALGIFDCCWD